MTKEVSEAAGRLRVYADPVRCCEYKDLRLVVDAYLALIPADDGEAIDPVWLQSLGFKVSVIEDWWQADYVCPQTKWEVTVLQGAVEITDEYGESFNPPRYPATRGMFRRLFDGLAIPLKEQP